MRIRQEQRERVIAALSAHLLATGLAQTSLRPLAAAAGISDRMLLYYFRDKADVLGTVIGRIADGFAEGLDAALPAEPMPPERLLVAASLLVRSPAMQPSMRLWLDIAAAAARQEPPFPAIASQILDQFMAWLEARMDRPASAERRQLAALLLAVIDGLALFDMAGGTAQADAATAALARLRFD
ncbi:TetR family transcriptional regulator [Sphingomonas sp. IBVSS1]|uniref:TetR/AcrR family transcriptional regulator n=1 Tax=Sandarakinorhabdus cyanobacteriorum TaxID=1981098 RepID=A0A255Z933_9SPHN|nr:TetR/AcrR family transcriptional regulator [Sandarakinorhabdus cyanobacteriorum]OSZ67077.1 TetR family transcriptional regulator [Sphingomonas sp. IBVSS1]OYQ37931.1 TetR/AcrR family transcriptional regulator [Sandarakinorhabdus cyanobacteriorum]